MRLEALYDVAVGRPPGRQAAFKELELTEHELSSHQLKHLRGLGRTTPALGQVGKSGVTEAVAHKIGELLAQRELVKVRVLEAAPEDRRTTAEQLAEMTHAALVAVVGRTALLYKPNPELEPGHRIHLPQ